MNIYVLSELSPSNNHIGWSVSYGLEEVLATTCNAQFLYPQPNGIGRIYETHTPGLFGRAWQRLCKSWYTLDTLPTLGDGPNVLLVVGLMPSFPASIFALGPLLDRFDLKIAYLLDGFLPANVSRNALPWFDQVFVISSELADEMQETCAVATSFLPLGVNVADFASPSLPRSIDVFGYGRIRQDVHASLQQHFNQQAHSRVYLHSTFDQGTVKNPKEHITLHNKLLGMSKISLCFEVSDVPRFRGRSPLVYRWLEGWAAGCAIVGKRPFGQGVGELLDWQDSTIEMPDSPQDWIPFFEALLDDEARLTTIAARNQRECQLRHDWRYRLRDLFQQVNLPLPTSLELEISQLQSRWLQPELVNSTFHSLADDRDLQPSNDSVRSTLGVSV